MTVPVIDKQIEEVLQAAAKPGAADATMQQLGDKFRAMMEKPHMAPPASQDGDGMNVIGAMAAQQDAELQRAMNDMTLSTEQIPYMSMQEMTITSMRLTSEVAQTQLDMQVKMGVVDSSKSAVETLMKNQ